MKIEDAMTPCPYKVESNLSMEEAVNKMKLHRIRHLPVVENGALLGVVSERDLILSQIVCSSSKFCPTLGELCSQDVLVVDAGDSLAAVVGEMADKKSEFALVSKDNELVGIFTTVDVCRTLQRTLEGKA